MYLLLQIDGPLSNCSKLSISYLGLFFFGLRYICVARSGESVKQRHRQVTNKDNFILTCWSEKC